MATQITLPVWPGSLPCPLASSYSYQPKVPFMRTEMDSGKARQRRRFRSTPTMIQASFSVSQEQLATFEGFLEYEVIGGAAWFEMPLFNGQGKTRVKARMTGAASVALVVPNRRWTITMELETLVLPVIPYDQYIGAIIGDDTFVDMANRLHHAVNVVLP